MHSASAYGNSNFKKIKLVYLYKNQLEEENQKAERNNKKEQIR